MMSSIMSKQLGDFLQEQQEPFILEVYLLERGYSSSSIGTCLKRSVSSGLRRNRKFIPNCSRIVRALFSRTLTVTEDQKVSNISGIRSEGVCVSEMDNIKQEMADDDKFSSASSATMFNSCSESDGEDAHYAWRKDGFWGIPDYYQAIKDENEVTADRRFRLENGEDGKQLSPVSVLEHTQPADGSPFCRKDGDARRHKQISTTVCACKSEKPFCSGFGEFCKPDASSQYAKNKKAVQKSKLLLFDCVREVVEKHKKYYPEGQQIQQIMGHQKLWELICQNIWLWSKESIHETNTTHLLHLDLLSSAQEWSNFEHHRQEIGIQLADAMLEDISYEVITDMTKNS
ncbi:uncharacterized protein [Coffea arabica]|uniref:DUF4378 domain-containing protein n=1 Tax=Coffea arabica TaxID=13443 RepID=A0A6P6USB0_COFAR|nr:uncharacterized protein LOC113713847 [Coffea arabica]